MTLVTHTFVEKPAEVQAVVFDGGVDSGPPIVEWITNAGGFAMWLDAIEPTEDLPGREEIIRIGTDTGTLSAPVGTVIFKQEDTFKILPLEEFNKKYAAA